MLTNQDIMNLIGTPKIIGARSPANAYRQEHGHKRCDIDLQATSDNSKKFEVFIRQNDKVHREFLDWVTLSDWRLATCGPSPLRVTTVPMGNLVVIPKVIMGSRILTASRPRR